MLAVRKDTKQGKPSHLLWIFAAWMAQSRLRYRYSAREGFDRLGEPGSNIAHEGTPHTRARGPSARAIGFFV